jgi:hypothetical protein
MTDTMRIHDPPSQPPGREERSASEADAVDKNARPAGRRFQSFTPPDIAALGRRPGAEESTPPSPAVVGPLLRTKVRRRDLLVALALAVAAALVVAAMMRVHVAERDRPSAMPSAASATTPAAASVVAVPASLSSEPVASATGSTVVDVSPPVPSVTTRVFAPATTSVETPPEPDRPPPGPHPMAPVEPPF